MAERWHRNELLMILNGTRTLLLSPAVSLPRYFWASLRQGSYTGLGGGFDVSRLLKRDVTFCFPSLSTFFFFFLCPNIKGADELEI